MISTPFQPQYTWRKLWYTFFTDSLKYREVLNENPQWNVTELPPVGAQLRISSPSSQTGGLIGSSFMFGLASGNASEVIEPYNSISEYTVALGRYSVGTLQNREAINGYTSDSFAAYSGIQNQVLG